MILKDFLEQIRHTKISGTAFGSPVDTIELCFGSKYVTSNQRFIIETFDGVKIEKNRFKRIEDITNNLLQSKLIKWDIVLGISNNGNDYTSIEFVVSI